MDKIERIVNYVLNGGVGKVSLDENRKHFEMNLFESAEDLIASFNNVVPGLTTAVEISADNAGEAGNITLTGDGTDSVADLVDAWNTANPSNTITIDDGDDTQIPVNGAKIQLTGGGLSDSKKLVTQPTHLPKLSSVGIAIDCTEVANNTGEFIVEAAIWLKENDGTVTKSEWADLGVAPGAVLSSDALRFRISLTKVAFNMIRVRFVPNETDVSPAGKARVYVAIKHDQ